MGLATGLLGFGIYQGANAETVAEGCRVRACRQQTLRQNCLNRNGRPVDRRCCAGLKCNRRRGQCVFERDHGAIGDFCRNTDDCDSTNFCRKNQCIPNSCR
jgi:hypothetical protein